MIGHLATAEQPQLRLDLPPAPVARIHLRITVDGAAHGPAGERRFIPVLWIDDDTGKRMMALDLNNKKSQLLLHADPGRDAVDRAPRGFWEHGETYDVQIEADSSSVSVELRRSDGRTAKLATAIDAKAWPSTLFLSMDRERDHGGHVPAIGYLYEVLSGVVDSEWGEGDGEGAGAGGSTSIEVSIDLSSIPGLREYILDEVGVVRDRAVAALDEEVARVARLVEGWK